jgi:hypothetical protein
MQRLINRIAAATRVRESAQGSWAKNYWACVVEALLRQARLTNKN